jgi:hypothetical protein
MSDFPTIRTFLCRSFRSIEWKIKLSTCEQTTQFLVHFPQSRREFFTLGHEVGYALAVAQKSLGVRQLRFHYQDLSPAGTSRLTVYHFIFGSHVVIAESVYELSYCGALPNE